MCHKRNIHYRSLEDIEAVSRNFQKTPEDYQLLDPSSLLVIKKEEPKVDVDEVKSVDNQEKMETEEISDDEVEMDEVNIFLSKNKLVAWFNLILKQYFFFLENLNSQEIINI